MTTYTCKVCGHIYGHDRPSTPLVALHMAVSHGLNETIEERAS